MINNQGINSYLAFVGLVEMLNNP